MFILLLFDPSLQRHLCEYYLSLIISKVGSGLALWGDDSSCSYMVSAWGLLLWLGVVVSLVGWTMGIFRATLTVCKCLVQIGSGVSRWGN